MSTGKSPVRKSPARKSPASKSPARANQHYRTRKDLLAAAAGLMKDGHKPSLEEVAEAARVSRATAYRYFPNLEVLLAEASVHIAAPDGPALFSGDASRDVEARLRKAEAALHRVTYDNEPAIRVMLASLLLVETQGVPIRQNRRQQLIEAALAPARGQLDTQAYGRLCGALSLIFGPEAMIVFEDVLRVDEAVAQDVKAWAIHALVQAAFGAPPGPKMAARKPASPSAR
ncbi:TetR/AcrR family transcriptional regulator [Xanthobacter autotrophicus]|uniref:TetR/AcrR family transcriptional regulator n=1 Tax=Xanthobacter TaxID=279 RepID=UPI0024ABD96E|nr:TetR/AcrR family transcriptional regulator [Xanthobacter autotrophicus]MDI4663180.1 TetR/AcrR family transcriptional regulator [Xanthobacter autotrophicus]